MMQRSIGATWFCVLLLFGLFCLCLTTPRNWQRIARRQATIDHAPQSIAPVPRPSTEAFLPTNSASRPLYTRDNPLREQALAAMPAAPMVPAHDFDVKDFGEDFQHGFADDFVVENLPLVGPDNDDFFSTIAEYESEQQGDPFQIDGGTSHEVATCPDSSECSDTAADAVGPTLIDFAEHGAPTPADSAPRIEPTPFAVDDALDQGPQFTIVAPTRVADQPAQPADPPSYEAHVPQLARTPSHSREPPPAVANDQHDLIPDEPFAVSESEAAPVRASSGWIEPAGLRRRLDALEESPATAPWARQVHAHLDRLAAIGSPYPSTADPILAQLRQLSIECERIALRLDDETEAESLRRANHALTRRLMLWEGIAALPEEPDALVNDEHPQHDRLLAHLTRVDELTATAPQGKSWRDYLLLDGLRELAENRQEARERRRRVAREVLDRLSSGQLSLRQRRFAASEQFSALRNELRLWAADPVDVEQLLREIEFYEETRAASSGEIISSFYQQLAASRLPAAQRLAKEIDANYRGANVRIVVTDTLLTKMMPEREPMYEAVREELMGIPTSGHTTTTTGLSVHLVPDPHRLRFVLEASGLVHARTSATSTGATVFAGMNSSYQILKPFEISLDGMKTDGAAADAQARTHLRGVDTPLSGIPLVGTMVDGFVRQQYRERRAEAEQELRRKIIRKAVNRMESEVDERLVQTNEQLRQRVIIPLERLQLRPAVAESQTTHERLTLRLRLAADHQLAALTPRPRARSDSLASFQVHESVLNNIFNQLDLNGRQFSQAELFLWIAERLNLPDDNAPDNLRDDVLLTFAPQDAFRIRAQDGRLEIELHLAELIAESNTFRDFTVRVYYRPDEEIGTGDLVRDGVVQLIGQRITMRGQVALRGIFSKTFPRERRFSLLPARFSEDPNLADVRVTQFVVTDGWIGIALGHDRSRRPDLITAQVPAADPR